MSLEFQVAKEKFLTGLLVSGVLDGIGLIIFAPFVSLYIGGEAVAYLVFLCVAHVVLVSIWGGLYGLYIVRKVRRNS